MLTLIAICALLAVSEVANAVFILGTGTTVGTVAAAGTATLGLGATTAVAGLAAIKAVAVLAGASAESGGRFRRQTESGLSELEEESAFAVLSRIEPEACIRRLICDLASGEMASVNNNDVILTLFNREASISSPKFDFTTAARLGQELRNVEKCELRYSCPISGQQLDQLLE